MVVFSTMVLTHPTVDEPWDYNKTQEHRWNAGSQDARTVPKPSYCAIETGVYMPRNLDLNYFAPDFGNVTNAFIKGIPLTETGNEISRAYNLEVILSEFMNPEPDAIGAELYHKFRDFLAKNGYKKSFEFGAIASGFLNAGEIMAVIKETIFANRKYGKMRLSKDLESYTAEVYNDFLHETAHKAGIGGGVEGEYVLESLLAEFTGKYISQIASAKNISEAQRVRYMRLLRKIKAISEARKARVKENYGNRPSKRSGKAKKSGSAKSKK